MYLLSILSMSMSYTERSIKYSILFLTLTFTFFFLFELMKRLAIHPVQYGCVGLALAVFFLLLISLSEHIGFVFAYSLFSAFGCVAILSVYLSAALKDLRLALAFSAALSALYEMLFAVLQSEDNALLMGSLLIFAVLSAAMIATRHIDWYAAEGVGKNNEAAE